MGFIHKSSGSLNSAPPRPSQSPVDRLDASFLQSLVGPGEALAVVELAEAERGGVGILQHHVLITIDQLLLLVGKVSPQEEDHHGALGTDDANHLIRESLPPIALV